MTPRRSGEVAALTALDRWLDDVSLAFPADTARRIRADLEEHALALMERAREEEHPDAEAAALATLGDAGEVRRSLEASHFTWAEDWELEGNRLYGRHKPQRPRDLLVGLIVMLGAPFLGFLLPVASGFGTVGYGFYAAGSLLLVALTWSVQRQFPARSARVLRPFLGQVTALYATLALLLLWHGGRMDLLAWVGGLLGFAVASVHLLLPLWPHLPKALRRAC